MDLPIQLDLFQYSQKLVCGLVPFAYQKICTNGSDLIVDEYLDIPLEN